MRTAGVFLLLSSCVIATHSFVGAFGWQGRYWLPVIAGSLVLCVPAMHGRALSDRGARRLVASTAGVLLGLQLTALLWNMWRYAYGVAYLEPRFPPVALPIGDAGWQPIGGEWAVGGIAVVALVLLGIAVRVVMPSRSDMTASGPSEAVGQAAEALPSDQPPSGAPAHG